MKVPDTGKIISAVYIGAALIGVYLVYKIFSGVGLIRTGERKRDEREKSEAETNLRNAKYFSPTFLIDKKDIYKPLGKTTAKDLAVMLRVAMKWPGTDEEKINSIFGRLNSRWNISEVALYYKTRFNRDLLSDLLNELTDREQVTLWNIIIKLPEK